MRCDEIHEQFGAYLDGEASPQTRQAVEAHLAGCAACQRELHKLRALVTPIAPGPDAAVPPQLWDAIAARLDRRQPPRRAALLVRLRPLAAIAACVLLVAGIGYVVLSGSVDFASRAEAATVRFDVLLDGLPVDPSQAFERFIALYHGRPVSAEMARQHAPDLNFALPRTLPDGFELKECFALRIGGAPAVAARYERNGELLGAIFHRAIHPEDYGTHKDHPCVIGQHRGHAVEVGEWHLVHLTDPTTCHCVLSRLDQRTELPAVLGAVAPASGPTDHDCPEGGSHP